jgi:DnaJ-class molecular chaperone
MNIFEKKKQLNDFLKEFPEMRPLQAKLEEQMRKAGSIHNRQVVLHLAMKEQVAKLGEALSDLVKAMEGKTKPKLSVINPLSCDTCQDTGEYRRDNASGQANWYHCEDCCQHDDKENGFCIDCGRL